MEQLVYVLLQVHYYKHVQNYYQKEFNYLHELVDDVLMSGMDPNYEITRNGVGMKEMLNELIGY